MEIRSPDFLLRTNILDLLLLKLPDDTMSQASFRASVREIASYRGAAMLVAIVAPGSTPRSLVQLACQTGAEWQKYT